MPPPPDTGIRLVCLFSLPSVLLSLQATAPQNVRGSVLTYSSEQLLVHLDDQDERMQRAVFAVLEASC